MTSENNNIETTTNDNDSKDDKDSGNIGSNNNDTNGIKNNIKHKATLFAIPAFTNANPVA